MNDVLDRGFYQKPAGSDEERKQNDQALKDIYDVMHPLIIQIFQIDHEIDIVVQLPQKFHTFLVKSPAFLYKSNYPLSSDRTSSILIFPIP